MKTLTVKNIEWKPTKDGSKQYMAVILTNGQKDSTKSIFDPEQQKVFQEAYYNNKTVNVEFEKDGQFWNVKSVEIVKGETPVSTSQNTKPDKVYGRDDDRMDRRTALMQAVELYKHIVAPQIPFDDEMYDGIYMHFLKLLNPLIIEALKEGARIKDA